MSRNIADTHGAYAAFLLPQRTPRRRRKNKNNVAPVAFVAVKTLHPLRPWRLKKFNPWMEELFLSWNIADTHGADAALIGLKNFKNHAGAMLNHFATRRNAAGSEKHQTT